MNIDFKTIVFTFMVFIFLTFVLFTAKSCHVEQEKYRALGYCYWRSSNEDCKELRENLFKEDKNESN